MSYLSNAPLKYTKDLGTYYPPYVQEVQYFVANKHTLFSACCTDL